MAAPMVAANSTMADAFEFIKEIMGTVCAHNGDEHPMPPSPKRMSSGPTSEESTTKRRAQSSPKGPVSGP